MRHRHAFTLVELLVVIGIIAVLVAILLPSLNKARRAAQTTACLSNLRQVAMAVHQYAAQFKGALPYHISGQASTDLAQTWRDKVFWGALIDIKSFGVKSIDTVITARGDAFALVKIVPVLKCPGELQFDRITHPDFPHIGAVQQQGRFRNGLSGNVYTSLGADARYGTSFNKEEYRLFTHYGVSANDAVDSWQTPVPFISSMNLSPTNPWPSDPRRGQKQISRVPSKTWLAFDGLTGLAAQQVVFRHPNLSCNFAYFDGHAENLRVGDVDGLPGGPPTPYVVSDKRALAEK